MSAVQKEIDLTQVSVQGLDTLRKSTEKDLEALLSNYSQLKDAQARFHESGVALSTLPKEGESKELLVPLTSSLYVPGKIHGDNQQVLIDIGTGYFVGKDIPESIEIMNKKVNLLKVNTDKLQKV